MTSQAHEKIMIDGGIELMATCPELPVYSSQIIELPEDEIEGVFTSTACWRQYIATWKISGDKLYLIGVEGKYILSENKPIFAYWFSGLLKIQQGDILKYIHCGYASTYERELHITVEKGLIAKKVNIKNDVPPPPRMEDIPKFLRGRTKFIFDKVYEVDNKTLVLETGKEGTVNILVNGYKVNCDRVLKASLVDTGVGKALDNKWVVYDSEKWRDYSDKTGASRLLSDVPHLIQQIEEKQIRPKEFLESNIHLSLVAEKLALWEYKVAKAKVNEAERKLRAVLWNREQGKAEVDHATPYPERYIGGKANKNYSRDMDRLKDPLFNPPKWAEKWLKQVKVNTK